MSIAIFEKIEKVRAAESLTQAEFALKIGVSVNTLIAMKSRGSSPRFEVVEKVAEVWPQYAYWLITDRTDPPNHISPIGEFHERVLFDVVESIDQKELIAGQSFVEKNRIHSAVFLVEDTDTNQDMKIFLSIWVDELSSYRNKALFGSPVVAVDPRFDLSYMDYPGAARNFKQWCDENHINKFSLHFVEKGALEIISKSRMILESYFLPDPEQCSGAEVIMENFERWKSGTL